MKTKIYLLLLLNIFVLGIGFSQNRIATAVDTGFFNYAYWNGVAMKRQYTLAEKAEFLAGQKQIYLEEKNHQHTKSEDLIWVTHETAKKGYGSNSINAGPCTNVNFETGTFAGWTRSSGFNPLTNVAGCCATANGDQTIVTGALNDPFGGFPIVYPGGGNFSAKLGSTATGGRADRISQTFFVTPANANFTYRYAVVLNDGGHGTVAQPRFTSEIIDTLGNRINCTYYEASAGSGVLGFIASAQGAPNNGSPVIYKTWTDVAIDLTPNIGQNVTLRFTVFDCGPSGHFAYAYLDGICTNFQTSTADTTCPGVPTGICAPAGFLSTIWNGPGVVNDPTQCILVSTPGVYVCTTLLSLGCPGPTFTHTLGLLPNPVLSFTEATAGVCATQYTFTSIRSIPTGSISSIVWEFGDGTTSAAGNPVHNYSAAGTYTVKLKAISSRGCVDSVMRAITIFPFPTIAFTPPSNCVNTLVQFVNTSTIGVGAITGYTWTLGNGPTSNLINPTNTYGANGVYTITLVGTSNLGCTASLTKTLGIFPNPTISLVASPLCDVNGTAFSAITSNTTISGTLAVFNWDFGDGGTSTLANPLHIYNTPGAYTVSLTALSVHNCSATSNNTFIISPSPTVAFATTSVNACSPNFTFTNNSAIASGPISYTWSFGGTNTTTAVSPSYTFPTIGSYTVRLIGRSIMGCLDTAIQYISVFPYPVINFSVPSSCENAVFTVSTTAVSGSVTSYAWDFGDPVSGVNNTSVLQSPTHFYNTTNVYTIQLNIVSNQNCASSYSTQITVFPNPVAIFSYSTVNNCTLPYTYLNTSSVSSIGASVLSGYKWNFGAAGTSTLANPGTISFPANGSYSVSLIVSTNHNCLDTMSFTIPVFPFPQLSFTANAQCLSTPVAITSSSFISSVPALGSIGSYSWNLGDNTFSNTLQPANHTYSASGIYTLTLGGTSNMGCSASISKTVEVLPTPVINFTTTGNMCLGIPSQFTSTSSISSGTIFALNWNYGDTTTINSIQGSNQNSSHTYAAPGTYTVRLTATTNNECTVILPKVVTIFPLPVVTFTANNVCLNQQTQFSHTITPGPSPVVSWNWGFGDGNFSTAQNPVYTYTAYAPYVPSLTVTSLEGCIRTITNNLTVHPLPTVVFTPTGACVNAVLQFTNTSFIPTGNIASFIWNFGDGTPTVSATAPAHTFSTASVYGVSVIATSNQGCSGIAANNIAIFPYPSVSITPINSSCVNQSVSIYPNVTITGSNNPISGYTVSFGDGSPAFTSPSFTQTLISHLYAGYNNYTVTLSASSNGCSSSTTTISKVYPNPFTNFVSNTFCFNALTQFINTSTIAATYSIQGHNWDFGDGAAPQATTQNTSHVFSTPGTFSVTLTEFSLPEPGLTCSLSAVKTVTIRPIPAPGFTNSSSCEGFATTFTNTTGTSTAQTITGWSWYFYNNGTLHSSALNPSFTYSANGSYSTALTALNNFGCSNTVINTVNVWANPVPSFTAANNCFNIATTFTESTIISNTLTNSLATWIWRFGDNSSPTYSNTQNPAHVYLVYGTYIPTLTVVSNKGCTGTITSSITVHPLPVLAFTPPFACVNTPVQLINGSTIPLGSISSYVWNFNDGTPTVTVTSPIHTYTNPATYSVMLTATSNQGCVNTGTGNLVINPYPTIQTANPLLSNCVNNIVTISPVIAITGNNNAISGYTVGFGDGTPVYTVASPTQYSVGHIYTANPVNNTYTITLRAVSNGCATTTLITMNIYARPTANFSSSKFCHKDATTFVNLSTIPASGTITGFNWDFDEGGAGVSTSTLTNPTFTYLGVGIHNVSLTALSNPEPTLACNTTAVKTITINTLPQLIGFTSTSVCLGNTTQFTNTTPNGGITGWNWNTNSVLFSLITNPAYTYTSSGKFRVDLTATNNFGCKNSGFDTVRVYANPTASFTTNNECLGNQTLLTDQSTFIDGTAATYTWITPGGNPGSSSLPSAQTTYILPGTYTVQYFIGSTLGCVGKFTNTVKVYPLPNINFTATEVCQNNPTQFINLSSISTGSITSFLWTFRDPSGTNTISTLRNPTYSFSAPGSFTTTLEAVSDQNCGSPSKTVTVFVRANPVANFSHNTICVNDKQGFVNLSSTTDGTITSNFWDFNGDNVVDLNNPIPSYVYTLSGNYTTRLKIITQYGCFDTTSQQVSAYPKAIPLISSDIKSGCPPLRVNFKNVSTISSGSFTTEWNFGDGSPANTFTNASPVFNTGNYNVTLIMQSDKGCITNFTYPGYVSVFTLPTAGFRVEPEEVDENEPIITVSNESSADANFIKYYINDGSSFGTPNFSHLIKNLKSTKPLVVQVVKNQAGCSDTISQVLNIKPAYVVYFPDVFTPNGDGINDDFRPKGVGILKFNMQVFDRWGHQVFNTQDFTNTWDGTVRGGQDAVKEDIYTWKAQVTDVFSKNHFLVGKVTVIR